MIARWVRAYRVPLVGLGFGSLLAGATWALGDIGRIRYSREAASTPFTEEAWRATPMQQPKPIGELLEVLLARHSG